MNTILFSGKASPFGGLSNEQELVNICPKEFKRDNKWSDLADMIFFKGADTRNWKYKSLDKDTQNKQKTCLMGLLSTFGIKHEDKSAVGGWMLSEILEELPNFLPNPKSEKEIEEIIGS